MKRSPLTPRHLFRVASHSKSFTAAGIMKLREQRKLRLDDRVGRYVDGLHPALARATIAQLLSHSAGVVRDGPDAGQFQDRRPFLDEAELRAQLKAPPVLKRNTLKNERIALAGRYASHGEPARLVCDRRGAIVEAWLGGTRYLREASVAKEMETRYDKRG